jgi:FkbM family methyltransferase
MNTVLSARALRWARRFKDTRVRRLPLARPAYRMLYRIARPGAMSAGEVAYRGLRLSVPPEDPTAAALFAGDYEEAEISLFCSLAAMSRLVVDIGANIGVYTCAAAAHLEKYGHVIAFEPVPANLDHLNRNVLANGLSGRVTVEAAAVGEKGGQIKIHLARFIGRHSISAANALGASRSISAPMVTLDSYLAAHAVGDPDIVKIDVEGYDGHVLRGAMETLRRATPTLFVEYSPSHLTNCGFDPKEFLRIIFDHYSQVFMVDERSRHLVRCRDSAHVLTRKGCSSMNLLAVERASHMASIRTLWSDDA